MPTSFSCRCGTLPDAPLSGNFNVEPGGQLKLGPAYGAVSVEGMTPDEAEVAITRFLEQSLKAPRVFVSLVSTANKQQIAGEHLVATDGTVTLGSYGCVPVLGQTVSQAKQTIELYLAQFLDRPEVSVTVFSYNSKAYYVVTQGEGLGDGVYRFPVTGNETVLDAIAQMNGLDRVSSKKNWIARPTDVPGQTQILPVAWDEITSRRGRHTLAPITRFCPAIVCSLPRTVGLPAIRTWPRSPAPFERLMGFSLLGVGTATRFSGNVLAGGGNPRASF